MISGRGIAPTRCRATTDGASATSTSPARVVTNWVSPGRCRGTKPKTRERLRSASGQKRLTITEVSSIVEVVSKRVPWNKGKIVGAKPPLLISGTGWMAGIGHGQTHHSSGPTSAFGPNSDLDALKCEVHFAPDIVATVENRAARKISRRLIFGLLCRCVAFQRHYGGP
jgi:hypothetical protein